ncbi:hypothetical protein GGS21DRAFT_515277 [Xylaria nigripes]|nr:hypothetical protein GGS21DRAFT_515277 [Xylaria nigripes]
MADLPQFGSSADGTHQTANGPDYRPQPAHLRSCVLCRQRKVKCDRRQPCSNCVRARAECVHPPGAGRAAKRPRQVVDARILDRLAQLETTINHLQQQARRRDLDSHPSPSGSLPQHAASEAPPPRDSQGFLVDDTGEGITQLPELGRLFVEESQSRYVSHIMWADLTESIEQLRGMFLDTDSREESSQLDDSPPLDEAESPLPGPSGSNAAIFGYRSVAHSLREFHPPVDLSMKLFQVFNDNVLPIVHAFHRPSLTRLFWESVLKPDALDKETEALLFSIYFSSIISLDATQCNDVIGTPRSILLERYKFAVEQALARACLLNTQSVLLLQAALLYVSVLRADDGTRTVWSLIALVTHVARSMGIHRDGSAFNLSPFETEMRRRIWHHLDILDYRATEYHGYEVFLHEESVFDTRWPLNVNDSDLSPDMSELPPDSDGATEMTFTQIRCRAMALSKEMMRKRRSPFQTRIQILDEYNRTMDKYIERCNPSQPLQYLATQIYYVSAARIRLATYYSELVARKRKGDADVFNTINPDAKTKVPDHSSIQYEPDNQTLREQLFETSLAIVRRTNSMMHEPRFVHWAWVSTSYVQWQILALILWEICIRPPSPQCDEAWKHTTEIYEKWLSVKFRNSFERGNDFIKPMNRLLARAQRVRDAQQRERSQAQAQRGLQRPDANNILIPVHQIPYETVESIGIHYHDDADTSVVSKDYQSDTPDSMAGFTATFIENPHNGPPVDGISDFNYMLQMLPDELQNEWLDSMAPRGYSTSNMPPYLS